MKRLKYTIILIPVLLIIWMGLYTVAEEVLIADPALEQAVLEAIYVDASIFAQYSGKTLSRNQLRSVETLRIRDAGITNLSGIHHLSSLKELDLRDNDIEDITELARLNHLQHLNLRGNHIKDISPLAGQNNLTYLNVRENHIADIHTLSSLTQLQNVNLRLNNIRHLEPLADLPHLHERLYVAGNPIADFSPLDSYFTEIKVKDFDLSGSYPIEGLEDDDQ